MQSLIAELQAALKGNALLVIGYLLLGILVFQTLMMLYSRLRRLRYERRQRELGQRHLQLLIKTATLQFQEAEQSRPVWNGYRKFTVSKRIC